MNYITKTVTTLFLIATAPFVSVDEAKASQCSRGSGFTVCSTLVARNGSYNRWNVTFVNSYTTEVMDVTCYGKEVDTWESNGGLSQSEANLLATAFCAA